ncbi:hypothetical protein D3C80_759300 [compost metagenome]
MRQEFERKCRCDFRNDRFTENDLLQEGGLDAGGTRRARQGVVDEEFQGIRAMLVTGILDQSNDFSDQRAIIDRLGGKPLGFSAFDFSQVFRVQVHHSPNVISFLALKRSATGKLCGPRPSGLEYVNRARVTRYRNSVNAVLRLQHLSADDDRARS